ncbi:MAG: transposase [Sedimenticola sp.]
MASDKTDQHPMGEQLRLMNILPHKLATTNDQLTSRAGLLAIAQVMESINLSERIDKYFPSPKSNRSFKPSTFIETFILMQHEGSFHLDDVRHINDDEALKTVLDLKKIPQASSLGSWLRRMGNGGQSTSAWREVNKAILKAALHQRKGITLDIDATEVIANKNDAQWTYKKNKGYMPMVGHIAEVGQIVACDFRQGNASPAKAKENFEFIQQCEKSLPDGCFVQHLRIDAAGYQKKIIQYCDDHAIHYAIRAKNSAGMKEQLNALNEADWQPLLVTSHPITAILYRPILGESPPDSGIGHNLVELLQFP